MWQCTQAVTDGLIAATQALLHIDSPTGFTGRISEYLMDRLTALGFAPERTAKGAVRVCLGGEGERVLLMAHVDTLGAMVRAVKEDGRLRFEPVGGLRMQNIEGEHVRVYTRDGPVVEGTIQCVSASSHVYDDAGQLPRKPENMEVVLDARVHSAEDVHALGVMAGDFICLDPRTRVSGDGYLKSRFLDDKASAGVLLTLAEQVARGACTPACRLYLLFTTYEEVGHGGAAGIPEGMDTCISVDMGCVGDDLSCDETMVSICAKDSGGPYDYDTVSRLVDAAKRLKLSYAVDLYPHYGSDVEATLSAGHDVRHGLIGPGVFASHGYERTHREGLANTLMLLMGCFMQSSQKNHDQ
ncbi:MAG: M42 family metallopeptidase [Christensenellales bacterium]|jgi:putative aminopeptidase FrvX